MSTDLFDPSEAVASLNESLTAGMTQCANLEADYAAAAKLLHDETEEEIKAATKDVDNISAGVVQEALRRQRDAKARTILASLVEKIQPVRAIIEKNIEHQMAVLAPLNEILRSPRAALEALGSNDHPRFCALLQELATAGPATLTTRLHISKMKNDIPAIAAIARILDGIPRDARPFSPQVIAEETIGPVWQARMRMLAEAKARVQLLKVRQQEASGHRPPLGAKIGAALSVAESRQRTPRGAPPAGPMTALQKISHGIDNLQEDGSVS